MGCDVHVAIEVQDFGEWRNCGNDLLSGRDYRFFADLSGVRGDCRFKSGPLISSLLGRDGVPLNATMETKTYIFDSSDHSKGYFTLEDAKQHKQFWKKYSKHPLIKLMKALKESCGIESDSDIRAIVGYDS